jgi:cell wall-associated NlpC family hydrolase
VLAGIGKVESDHGRSALPGVQGGANAYGARGPMQFLDATFTNYSHPIPAGGADPPSPYDPVDAVYAAARMLCADGAVSDVNGAVFAYNHSTTYVHHVLDWATRYTTTEPGPNPAATQAIAFAQTAIGLPYVWGGNGPPTDFGYDCSGLTKAAYQSAGIELPRTAQEQYDTGPHLPPDAVLRPGDLVFYGTPHRIHHVGIYLGAKRMIDAPDFGLTVTTENYRWPSDDYTGATRPTN